MSNAKFISLLFLGVALFLSCTDIPDDLRNGSDGGWVSSSSRRSSSSNNMGAGCKDIVFNPSSSFCYDGDVYSKCNGMVYNPTTHICEGSVANPAKCDGWPYNPLENGCCNDYTFSLSDQRCQKDVIETKCGAKWYDAEKYNLRCKNDVIETMCGDHYRSNEWVWYDASNSDFRCKDDNVETKCGAKWYEVSSSLRCNNDVVEKKCGSDWYDFSNSTLVCNGVIETRCGYQSYDASNSNLRCKDDRVEAKCGEIWFYCSNGLCYDSWHEDNNGLRCRNDILENKCGTKWYDAANDNLRCNNDVIETVCGTNLYNPATEFCSNNSIYSKCGGSEYNIETQVCCNNIKYSITATQYCSNGTMKNYDGSITDARDGKKYNTTIIGTQTWMADNLNYYVSGSKCHNDYNNNTADCDKYGREYDWATAMALPASCNSSYCASEVSEKHRGICPSGWHLPRIDEWRALTDYVGGDSTAGKYLKTSDCGGTGDYGFITTLGSWWWSASGNSYYDGNRANVMALFCGEERAVWFNQNMSYLYAVRCLKDD